MQDITPLPIARADSASGHGYGSVPVKKPVASASLTQQVDNPISTDARTLAQFASEAEMDKILDDINKKVQAGKTQETNKKGIFSFLKRSEKKPSTPQPADKAEATKQFAASESKRKFIPVVVVAVIVAVALCGLAFAAFAKQTSQPTNDQNQSSTASNRNNTSVTTEDIDKLSSEIKDKAESLSAEQDFSSEELNDSALGL